MDNIKKDEVATFCCVGRSLTGKKKLFLKTKAARGRWEVGMVVCIYITFLI